MADGEASKGRRRGVSDEGAGDLREAAGGNVSPKFVWQKREECPRVFSMEPELPVQTDGPSKGLIHHRLGGKKEKKNPWLLSSSEQYWLCEIVAK